MQITRTDIYRFRLPFVRPIRVGRELLTLREGFVLALTDSDGRIGHGEIAPLPGFDDTAPEQCLRELIALRGTLGRVELHYDRFDLAAPFLGLLPLPASATTHTLFGIESALLALALQHGSAGPLPALPRFPERFGIPVSGLFVPQMHNEGLADQIRRLRETGVQTVKVKIGRLPIGEEVRQILELCAQIGNGPLLRLDGNRGLSADDYRRYREALGHLPVDYAEEPLRDGESFPAAEGVAWPLALDESLAALLDPSDPRPSRLPPEFRTIILKPGLLMGLHGMARCVADADRAAIRTVLSSAFNTGLTLSVLAVFARLAGLPPQTAHGLDTLGYLSGDLLLDPPRIADGMLWISMEPHPGEWPLDRGRIREEA